MKYEIARENTVQLSEMLTVQWKRAANVAPSKRRRVVFKTLNYVALRDADCAVKKSSKCCTIREQASGLFKTFT